MARTVDAGPKPRNDAYTGLLAISFLALVGGTVLMALDADELGKLPGKLPIDVPGINSGKAGEGLRRPDAGAKVDTTEAVPMPVPMPKVDPAMSKRGEGEGEPGKLPALTRAEIPSVVVPVKNEEPVEGPPLPVKPFVPPM